MTASVVATPLAASVAMMAANATWNHLQANARATNHITVTRPSPTREVSRYQAAGVAHWEKAKQDLWGHCERLDASPQEWEGDNVQYSEAHEFREPPSEQTGPQIAAVTAMQRAQFLATSTEVSILDSKGAVVVQLSALIDSGAVMSCTPTSPVAHLLAHTSINRASAAALCTADGSPLAGVKGELVVPVRMGDRVFQVPMQVIDSDIPFILGMDFFEATHASINPSGPLRPSV